MSVWIKPLCDEMAWALGVPSGGPLDEVGHELSTEGCQQVKEKN